LQKSKIAVLQGVQSDLKQRVAAMQKAEAKAKKDLANANSLLQQAPMSKACPTNQSTAVLQQKIVEFQKLEEELRETRTVLADAQADAARTRHGFTTLMQKYQDVLLAHTAADGQQKAKYAAELLKQKQDFTSLVLAKSKEIDMLKNNLAALVEKMKQLGPPPA
jgi:hypothetical protein